MLKTTLWIIVKVALLTLVGCEKAPSEHPSNTASESQAMSAMQLLPVKNPVSPGARLPNLSHSERGAILSWVDTTVLNQLSIHHLRYATYQNAKWSPVTTAASGSNWFLNWADFPSVYSVSKHAVAAHWLQRTSTGTYSYDVMTRVSRNGRDWSEPFSPHQDGTMTEHGFASFYSDNGQPALAWLDGRNTQQDTHDKSQPSEHDEHASGGAMTLRTATLTSQGETLAATELDASVCDCCQTSAVNTTSGPVIFYRDRTQQEIRDIAYVRKTANGWSAPKVVHNDQWHITGCPVNGPQADAMAATIALSWYTAADNKPMVKVAFSSDSGESFSAPLTVSDEHPLGRVDVAMLSPEHAVVTWLEKQADDIGVIYLQRFLNQAPYGKKMQLAQVSTSRQSGFAHVTRIDSQHVLAAWTTFTDDVTSILTQEIAFAVN